MEDRSSCKVPEGRGHWEEVETCGDDGGTKAEVVAMAGTEAGGRSAAGQARAVASPSAPPSASEAPGTPP